MQTLDLPAFRVTGIVEEIWRIARKTSLGATLEPPEFAVTRQLAAIPLSISRSLAIN